MKKLYVPRFSGFALNILFRFQIKLIAAVTGFRFKMTMCSYGLLKDMFKWEIRLFLNEK